MTFKNKIHHYFLPKPEKCVHKHLKMAKNKKNLKFYLNLGNFYPLKMVKRPLKWSQCVKTDRF